MIAFILAFFINDTVDLPGAQVEIVSGEFDAVWVPPGTTGPIVAVPLDEVVFELAGE